MHSYHAISLIEIHTTSIYQYVCSDTFLRKTMSLCCWFISTHGNSYFNYPKVMSSHASTEDSAFFYKSHNRGKGEKSKCCSKCLFNKVHELQLWNKHTLEEEKQEKHRDLNKVLWIWYDNSNIQYVIHILIYLSNFY